MHELMYDFRATVSSLLRRPGYPAVAVGILALGLGAFMAAVTYVDAFTEPFPGVEAAGLVRLFDSAKEEAYLDISYHDFLDYKSATENGSALRGLAAAQPYYLASVRLETKTEVASLEAVSGDYFSVLDVQPVVGRALEAGDDRDGAEPVAVLSHEWWQRSFGGDASVLGRTIYLNYRPFTVVGVAPPDFLGSTSDFRPSVWIPIAPFKDRYTTWTRRAENRDLPLVRVYGRLAEGASAQRGLTALASTAAGLDEAYPRASGIARSLRLDAPTWIDPRTRLAERDTVRMMTTAAFALLLLVCANVAGLLLSASVERRQEIAVRAALGAPAGRLVRLVLLENVLLSTVAGVIALIFAGPLSLRLGAYFARPSAWGVDVARQTSVDASVLAVALIASVLTGLVASLPAVRAWGRDLLAPLRATTGLSISIPRRIWGRRLPGIRDLLVSAQLALAVVLLIVAGLVFRTLGAASELDPGFSYTSSVASIISTSSTDLRPEQRDLFLRDLTARLAEQPWVESAAMADAPLLAAHRELELIPEGQSEPSSFVYSNVIPGFFAAVGIELRRGRVFADTDSAESRPVAVVNEELARQFFAGESPLGRHLRSPGDDRLYEIVGLVADTKTEDFLAPPAPTVYFSFPQRGYGTTSALMVSVRGEPDKAVPRLHRWLREHEAFLAIVNVVTYEDVVGGFLYAHRMNAEMFSIVAALGLALSVVGIWSVVSLSVSRRRREIALRMAVGARGADISRLILARAVMSVALGLTLGLGLSLALSELVRGLLFDIEPTDPSTMTAGAVLLAVSALCAAYLPARRAAATDPTASLRAD